MSVKIMLKTVRIDFEDAVQYAAGEHIQADYIVTRDTGGYTDDDIPAIQPADFLAIIKL